MHPHLLEAHHPSPSRHAAAPAVLWTGEHCAPRGKQGVKKEIGKAPLRLEDNAGMGTEGNRLTTKALGYKGKQCF